MALTNGKGGTCARLRRCRLTGALAPLSAIVLASTTPTSLIAADFNFLGDFGTGQWSNPDHWSPNGVPTSKNPNDPTSTGDRAILNGGRQASLSGDVSVTFFQHGNGVLTGLGNLRVDELYEPDQGSGFRNSVIVHVRDAMAMKGGITLSDDAQLILLENSQSTIPMDASIDRRMGGVTNSRPCDS